ncbi:MAG: META domain-containing protein [Bacteroidota bacterium]|nr:META domain-containing protein [Bacteroidota bacterium]
MKLITFVSAGTFILFSAFVMKKRADEQSHQQASSLYQHKWALKKIVGSAGEEAVLTKAFIEFNAEKKSAGGNGSCNQFGSSFILTDNSISFSNIFSTKMYCDGVQQTEDSFFKQLEKVNRFEVKDKTLFLYVDKDKLLEFTTE